MLLPGVRIFRVAQVTAFVNRVFLSRVARDRESEAQQPARVVGESTYRARPL